MGILDDAIREHLELKRRHGADPDELAQAEREALGPVRRERFDEGEPGAEARFAGSRGAGLAEPEHEAADDESGFTDEHDDLQLGDGEGRDGLSEAEYEEYYEEEYYEDEAGDWQESLHRAPESADREPVPPESAPPTQAARPEPTGGASEADETVEYSVEDAVRGQFEDSVSAGEPELGQAEPEADDMLEETPEFLQDAPEHDRLWFEQRPPRDFDFDG
jgi:hypothetical protein